MINIDQLIKLIGLFYLGIYLLVVVGVVIHLVLGAVKDLKELSDPKPKKKYWLIRYTVAEVLDYKPVFSYCIKAKTKAEAYHKFIKIKGKKLYSHKIEDIKELSNE